PARWAAVPGYPWPTPRSLRLSYSPLWLSLQRRQLSDRPHRRRCRRQQRRRRHRCHHARNRLGRLGVCLLDLRRCRRHDLLSLRERLLRLRRLELSISNVLRIRRRRWGRRRIILARLEQALRDEDATARGYELIHARHVEVLEQQVLREHAER